MNLPYVKEEIDLDGDDLLFVLSESEANEVVDIEPTVKRMSNKNDSKLENKAVSSKDQNSTISISKRHKSGN